MRQHWRPTICTKNTHLIARDTMSTTLAMSRQRNVYQRMTSILIIPSWCQVATMLQGETGAHHVVNQVSHLLVLQPRARHLSNLPLVAIDLYKAPLDHVPAPPQSRRLLRTANRAPTRHPQAHGPHTIPGTAHLMTATGLVEGLRLPNPDAAKTRAVACRLQDRAGQTGIDMVWTTGRHLVGSLGRSAGRQTERVGGVTIGTGSKVIIGVSDN